LHLVHEHAGSLDIRVVGDHQACETTCAWVYMCVYVDHIDTYICVQKGTKMLRITYTGRRNTHTLAKYYDSTRMSEFGCVRSA
jgi:hypothetical protein